MRAHTAEREPAALVCPSGRGGRLGLGAVVEGVFVPVKNLNGSRHFQYIADRGTCGKRRFLLQNCSPWPEPMKTGA